MRKPPRKRRRGVVVVWGYLASYPFGGMTWQVLHYLGGLQQAGFDVWYVEDSDNPMLHPDGLWRTDAISDNIAFLRSALTKLGLEDRWIVRRVTAGTCVGARSEDGLDRLYREADVVLNLCGSHRLRPDHDAIRHLVYVQTDPVLDQLAVASGHGRLIDELDRYDSHATYGTNLGTDVSPVPALRYKWIPTRPPVISDWWERIESTSPAAFTTIANWEKWKGKDIEWGGQTYTWRKDLAFLPYLDLPMHVETPLELALAGVTPGTISDLEKRGWRVSNASKLNDVQKYREFICGSRGEFSAVKDQYARTRSGWFSDRSVCYLAAGRPVILESTGYEMHIPTGLGLHSIDSLIDAARAIDMVQSDYARQSQAAQDVAREFFEAERVVSDLMTAVGFS